MQENLDMVEDKRGHIRVTYAHEPTHTHAVNCNTPSGMQLAQQQGNNLCWTEERKVPVVLVYLSNMPGASDHPRSAVRTTLVITIIHDNQKLCVFNFQAFLKFFLVILLLQEVADKAQIGSR